MYEIYLDDKIAYWPGDEICTVFNPEIKLKVSEAGYCKFTLPKTNPEYNNVFDRKTMVSVKRDGTEIFYGEVRESGKDKNGNKSVYAVGALSFLFDSIQPQYNYGVVTPLSFINDCLDEHNAQMGNDDRKKIYPGIVTVTNTRDTQGKTTNYDKTLDALREQLQAPLGGVFKLRHTNNRLYLDYLLIAEYGVFCEQRIRFGENMLDYSESMTADDVKTCIIPLGAKIDSDTAEGFEQRLDIKSVNNNKNYLESQSAIAAFGRVWDVVIFDDITTAAALKTAGNSYLSDVQYEKLVLKVKAIDLAQMGADVQSMNVGDRVNCQAEAFGMDRTFPIWELTLHPLAPQNDTVTLSETVINNKTVSARVSGTAGQIKTEVYKASTTIQKILDDTMNNMVAMFQGTNGGYKLSEYDAQGRWVRDLYMDNPDKNQATNIMQISMAGIAFSRNGYNGPYTSAWSLNGTFCADYILTGTLVANLIKAGVLSDVNNNFNLNMETGALTAKQLTINTPHMKLLPDGTLTSDDGDERLEIKESLLRGYYSSNYEDVSIDPNPRLAGVLDLAADYNDGTYQVVLESKDGLFLKMASSGEFRLEKGNQLIMRHDGSNTDFYIGGSGSFRFYQYRQSDYAVQCGYIDGNGWHGNVHGNVSST